MTATVDTQGNLSAFLQVMAPDSFRSNMDRGNASHETANVAKPAATQITETSLVRGATASNNLDQPVRSVRLYLTNLLLRKELLNGRDLNVLSPTSL